MVTHLFLNAKRMTLLFITPLPNLCKHSTLSITTSKDCKTNLLLTGKRLQLNLLETNMLQVLTLSTSLIQETILLTQLSTSQELLIQISSLLCMRKFLKSTKQPRETTRCGLNPYKYLMRFPVLTDTKEAGNSQLVSRHLLVGTLALTNTS